MVDVNAVPAFMVAVPSAVSLRVIFTSALGARADLGSYPNVFACPTTLDLSCEESINISFANMLA